MKAKLFLTIVLAFSLTGCLPKLDSSSEGLGNSKISFMLRKVTSPLMNASASTLQPYMKEKMTQYCEQRQLSQKLQQCLIEMGMMCEKQICRYHGYMTRSISHPFPNKTISEGTQYYTIEVDTTKDWDSFKMDSRFEHREFLRK